MFMLMFMYDCLRCDRMVYNPKISSKVVHGIVRVIVSGMINRGLLS